MGRGLNETHPTPARYVDAIRQRDWRTLGSTLSDDFSREDRRSGLLSGLVGRDNHVAGWKALTDQGISKLDVGQIARRGDSLCLYGGTISTPDGFEIGALEIFELDAEDRIRQVIFLDADDRDTAFAELDAMYLGGEGAPHIEILQLIRPLGSALSPRDLDALRRLIHPELVFVDHRLASLGRLVGMEQYLGAVMAMFDLVPDLRMYITDVHVAGNTGLARLLCEGTSPDGFAAEFVFDVVGEVVSGRLRHLEYFPLERSDEAVACFERLRLSH